MLIEEVFPEYGVRSSRFSTLVKRIGMRTMSVKYSGEGTDGLPPLHATVEVSFFLNEHLYSFQSVVQRYEFDLAGALILLQRPKKVTKVQRRFSYRVPVETRTTYRFHLPGPTFPEPLSAKIVNLSEGGMLITTNCPMYEGALLSIMSPSGKEGEVMQVTAEVLEVREDLSLRQETKIARLRFDGSERAHLTEEQRKGIVTYLFEQQRLMLQTRRLLNPAKKRP